MNQSDRDQILALNEEMTRANQAREVLEHPLYVESFNKLRDELKAEWEHSPARDTEAREKIWLALKLLDRTQEHMKTLMESGKLAARQKDSLLARINPFDQGQIV